MEIAVERIQSALMRKETVLIYGDYDVDGTTATSLLYLFLHEIGLSTIYYIPDREKEGYGLSRAGMDAAIEQNAKLIITCDCGINAFEEISYAKANGIDLIVTDHHEPAETLPEALAILNPKRENWQFLIQKGKTILTLLRSFAERALLLNCCRHFP